MVRDLWGKRFTKKVSFEFIVIIIYYRKSYSEYSKLKVTTISSERDKVHWARVKCAVSNTQHTIIHRLQKQ